MMPDLSHPFSQANPLVKPNCASLREGKHETATYWAMMRSNIKSLQKVHVSGVIESFQRRFFLPVT